MSESAGGKSVEEWKVKNRESLQAQNRRGPAREPLEKMPPSDTVTVPASVFAETQAIFLQSDVTTAYKNYPSATLPRTGSLQWGCLHVSLHLHLHLHACTHIHACFCICSLVVLESVPDAAHTARLGMEQGCAALATPNVPTKLHKTFAG